MPRRLLVIKTEPGTVDIDIDPSLWYLDLVADIVMDLSLYDYATTHQVVEFEAKLLDGFTKIELEGFND